jgi:hypothetical protein
MKLSKGFYNLQDCINCDLALKGILPPEIRYMIKEALMEKRIIGKACGLPDTINVYRDIPNHDGTHMLGSFKNIPSTFEDLVDLICNDLDFWKPKIIKIAGDLCIWTLEEGYKVDKNQNWFYYIDEKRRNNAYKAETCGTFTFVAN